MGSSSGGSSQPQQVVQQQQNQEPWGPSQQYLLGAMNSASSLYNSDQTQRPYMGQTQAGLSDFTTSGLQAQADIATAQGLGGSEGVRAARGLGTNLIQSQGLNEGTRAGIGQYNQIYADATGQQNPYLLDTIAANDRRIADKVNSAMSGAGRYGSGAHTDVLSRSLAEAANPLLLQDYEARQGRRLAATQGAAGLYGEGLNRAGQWSQAMPGLDEAQYAPARMLEGVGQFYSNRSQQALNDQIRQYEANAAYPWESLARYNAIIQGAGGLGGTKAAINTTSVPQASTLQRTLGGAVAGAGLGSIFGPVGTGVGALGGAGLGYFL